MSVRVEGFGIAGDRERALFALEGARAGKTYRGKENDRLHLQTDARDAAVLAADRGHAVELRRGEHFFDDAPISILVDAWMQTLNDALGYTVEWERFRPNFFVRANGSIAPEEAFEGAALTLGNGALASSLRNRAVCRGDVSSQGQAERSSHPALFGARAPRLARHLLRRPRTG